MTPATLDRDPGIQSRHDGVPARRQAHRGEVRQVSPRCAAVPEERRQGAPGAGVQAGRRSRPARPATPIRTTGRSAPSARNATRRSGSRSSTRTGSTTPGPSIRSPGKHATVPCAACHKDFSTPALKKPAFTTCTSCHKDAHSGTATLAGKSVDCASCHTVNGFVPSTYTVASHATDEVSAGGKAHCREVRCVPHPEHHRHRGDEVRQPPRW